MGGQERRFIKMKFQLEILKEILIESADPLQKNKKIKAEKLISTTKFNTLNEAKAAMKIKQITADQKIRIHKCYHDESNPQKCEIIE